MKKFLSLILCAMLVLATGVSAMPYSVIANPTTSEVVVDKGAWMFDAYNINDNNYFKLRDIAMAFTEEYSSNNFEVTWDESRNAINLITKTPYTPVGGECGGYDLELGGWPEPSWEEIVNGTYGQDNRTSQEAILSDAVVYIDGVKAELTAYNINDNNYFKLRDLAKALDFEVIWSEEENRIYISTEFPYGQ